MIDTEARRRTASLPAAFVFVALTVAGCGGTGPESGSADATVAGTVHVCDSCHGPGGRSISPTFPRLAGQQKDYIVAQLQAFRDKTRADPHAQTYMWGMAARLSDPTIDAIAAYYASQTPVAGQAGTSPEIVAGKKIFTEGIPSERACLPAWPVTARMQKAMVRSAFGGAAPGLYQRTSVGGIRVNGAGQRG